MNRTGLLSSLSLATLVVVMLLAAIALALFMRKRSNRHPLEGKQERNVARDIDAGREAPGHSPSDTDLR